jgi:hypothetical protein
VSYSIGSAGIACGSNPAGAMGVPFSNGTVCCAVVACGTTNAQAVDNASHETAREHENRIVTITSQEASVYGDRRFAPRPCVYLRSSGSRSIGRGKTIVEFCSAAISLSVCR